MVPFSGQPGPPRPYPECIQKAVGRPRSPFQGRHRQGTRTRIETGSAEKLPYDSDWANRIAPVTICLQITARCASCCGPIVRTAQTRQSKAGWRRGLPRPASRPAAVPPWQVRGPATHVRVRHRRSPVPTRLGAIPARRSLLPSGGPSLRAARAVGAHHGAGATFLIMRGPYLDSS